MYRFYDFCDEVIAAELRHQVNTLRPGFDGFDQLHGQFHADFCAVLPGLLHAPARLFRDGYPGHLILQETGMPGTDQRQDSHQHRPVKRTVFGGIFLKEWPGLLPDGKIGWVRKKSAPACTLRYALRISWSGSDGFRLSAAPTKKLVGWPMEAPE